MLIKLAYGKAGLTIKLSVNYKVDIIDPRWVNSLKDQSLQ